MGVWCRRPSTLTVQSRVLWKFKWVWHVRFWPCLHTQFINPWVSGTTRNKVWQAPLWQKPTQGTDSTTNNIVDIPEIFSDFSRFYSAPHFTNSCASSRWEKHIRSIEHQELPDTHPGTQNITSQLHHTTLNFSRFIQNFPDTFAHSEELQFLT